MSTLGTAGCFPAEGQLSHLSTCPKVCTDAHLLQGWETVQTHIYTSYHKWDICSSSPG